MTGLFGSAILDVAVGMVFVYLLVSLVVSAASELLAAMLKWRSKHLWKGINNLLRDAKESVDKKGSTPAALAAALYDHPIIKSLAQPGKKPSYIPSRTFALVLLDVVSNPAKYVKAELLKLTNGISDETKRTEVQAKIGTILDSGMPVTELKNQLNELLTPLPDNPVKTQLLALINKIPADPSDIKGIIDLFPNDDIKKTLRVLWEESGHNLEKLKENIEVWFNNAMDRVSGWYKRKSQLVNFIIAAVIAIWVNIDSEVIAKRLSTDSTLRTALVSQAEEYAKQPSNRPAPPPPAGAGQPAPGAQPQAPPEGQGANAGAEANPDNEVSERREKFNKSLDDIKKLGLPIGYQREVRRWILTCPRGRARF